MKVLAISRAKHAASLTHVGLIRCDCHQLKVPKCRKWDDFLCSGPMGALLSVQCLLLCLYLYQSYASITDLYTVEAEMTKKLIIWLVVHFIADNK